MVSADEVVSALEGFGVKIPLVGLLRTPEETYYVSISEMPYSVEIAARIGINMLPVPLKEPREVLESRIAQLKGKDVELEQLCPQMFMVHPPEYWNNWDGSHAGEYHYQTYLTLIKELKARYTERRTVLVIGCGEGTSLDIINALGHNAIGLEANPRNVAKGRMQGREIIQGGVHQLDHANSFDVIIEPGVFSLTVVTSEYTKTWLPEVLKALKPQGTFIQAPYAPSLVTKHMLEREGLVVEQCTIPKNLFAQKFPKQFYVAQKLRR